VEIFLGTAERCAAPGIDTLSLNRASSNSWRQTTVLT
jgi:hypothetical protein